MDRKKPRTRKITELHAEIVPIDTLHPHPKNYRDHPDDQVAHIAESIREHGFYRAIIAARDWTILAGEGSWLGAKKAGLKSVSAIRLDINPDDPHALKILTGDNEIGHLGESDDRALTELLKQIKDADPDGLLGTGFDDAMLANLIYVTRPEGEIDSVNEVELWAGMPEYERSALNIHLVVNFRKQKDKGKFLKFIKSNAKTDTAFIWWPARRRDDNASVKFRG